MPEWTCPDCGTTYNAEEENCPSCADGPAASGSIDDSLRNSEIVRDAQEMKIGRGMTISQFMDERGIEGGMDLKGEREGDTSRTASDLLESEKGRKYAVGDMVNRGGMGAILRAKDMNICRQVAMKVMLRSGRATDKEIIRFIEEAQITGQLEHPNIVPVHELGVDASGNVFFTMKLIKGMTLKDIIKGIAEKDPLIIRDYPLNRLLNIFLKICDAVAFAHSKRVLHRDLKPENIMIGKYGEVQVMDWGISKVIEDKTGTQTELEEMIPDELTHEIESIRNQDASQRTMAGKIVGTAHFMSPEQAYGQVDTLDERSDIYALGAILYNILSLHKPVEGRSTHEVLFKVIQAEVPELSTFEGENLRHCSGGIIPSSLQAIVKKAMASRADARYQCVAELQKDIEAYQTGFATSAEEATFWRQLKLLVGRHKREFSAAAVVFVLLAAVIAGAFLRVRASAIAEADQRREAEEASKLANQKAHEEQQAREALGQEKAKIEEMLISAMLSEGQEMLEAGKIMDAKRKFDDAFQREDSLRTRLHRWQFDLQGWEQRLRVPSMRFAKVYFSPDGRYLAIGNWSGEIIVHDTATGKELKRGKEDYVYDVNGDPGGKIACKRGDEIVWLTLPDLKVARRMDIKDRRPRVVFWDGTVLSTEDRTKPGKTEKDWVFVRLDTDGSLTKAELPVPDRAKYGRPFAWTASRDGSRLAFATWKGFVYVLQRSDLKVLRKWRAHYSYIQGLDFSPDGKSLATGGGDSLIRVWDMANGEKVRELVGHDRMVRHLLYSEDGRTIVSGGYEGGLRVWNVGSGKSTITLTTEEVCTADHTASSRDRTLLAVGGHKGAYLFRRKGKAVQKGQKVHDSHVYGSAYSADGNHFATCSFDGRIKLFRRDGMQTIAEWKLPDKERAVRVVFSQNSKLLAATGELGSVRVWQVVDGKEMLSENATEGKVHRCAFAADDTRLIVYPMRIWTAYSGEGSSGSDVVVYDCKQWKESCRRQRPEIGHVYASFFQALGQLPNFVRVAQQKEILVGDAETLIAGRLFSLPENPLSMFVAGDHRYVITGHHGDRQGIKGGIYVWDVMSPETAPEKLPGSAECHAIDGFITAMSVDRARGILTAVYSEGRVRIWDMEKGKLSLTFQPGRGPISSAAISPNGTELAIGFDDGHLFFYDLSVPFGSAIPSKDTTSKEEIKAAWRKLANQKLRPARIEDQLQSSLDTANLRWNETGKIEISFKNIFQRPMQLKLGWPSAPKGSVTPESITLDIEPGANKLATFEARFPDSMPDLPTLAWTGVGLKGEVIAPARQQGRYVIGNGEIPDQARMRTRHARQIREVRKSWAGPKDCSAIGWLRKTEEGFLFRAEVVDDKLRAESGRPWENDAVELFFDLRSKEKRGKADAEKGWFQIIAVPAIGKVIPNSTHHYSRSGAVPWGAKVRSGMTKTGYWVEVEVPFSGFVDLHGAPPEEFLFDFAVDDSDSTNGYTQQHWAGGKKRNIDFPQDWGIVRPIEAK